MGRHMQVIVSISPPLVKTRTFIRKIKNSVLQLLRLSSKASSAEENCLVPTTPVRHALLISLVELEKEPFSFLVRSSLG